MKVETEILHKEIDLIQNCINRMANNSFLLKGWMVSLVAVILALIEKEISLIILCLILLIPVLSFWYLDAFFLHAERKYRALYEWVLDHRIRKDLTHLYDLNPNRFTESVDSIWETMWSVTLKIFYGLPALILILIIIIRILQLYCDFFNFSIYA